MKHDYVGNNTTQGQRKPAGFWIWLLVLIVLGMAFGALFAGGVAG